MLLKGVKFTFEGKRARAKIVDSRSVPERPLRQNNSGRSGFTEGGVLEEALTAFEVGFSTCVVHLFWRKVERRHKAIDLT